MPQKRQSADEDRYLVRSLGLGLPEGFRIEPHAHPWHQLIYASAGVLSIQAREGSWVTPPQRALWIPAGEKHELRTRGRVRLETLYLHPDLEGLPTGCCVVPVSNLLREIIHEIMRRRMLDQGVAEEERLALVLIDQLRSLGAAPLVIRFPEDPRARRAAERIQESLSTRAPMAEIVRGCGASLRTLERLFVAETGMTLGRWTQQVKVLRALECLAEGETVTRTGILLGYENTSAFIAMFKRSLGTTPGQYFEHGNAASRRA